jgi:hypothetical protein
MIVIKIFLILLIPFAILMIWWFILSFYDIIRGEAFTERDFWGRRIKDENEE